MRNLLRLALSCMEILHSIVYHSSFCFFKIVFKFTLNFGANQINVDLKLNFLFAYSILSTIRDALCEFSLKKRFVLTYWLYLQVERRMFRKR